MIREGCVICYDCGGFLGYIADLGIHRANALKRCKHCAEIRTKEKKRLWAKKKRMESKTLADVRLKMLSEAYETIDIQKAYIAKMEERMDKQDECIETLEQKIAAINKTETPKKNSSGWLKFGKK